MKRLFKFTFCISAILTIFPLIALKHTHSTTFKISPETKLTEILSVFGIENPNRLNDEVPHDISKGKQLISLGVAIDFNGKTTQHTSHKQKLTCVTCHALEKEAEFVGTSDPEKRLEYSKENNVPFLPGTTFYGIVNRTSFFNGDYQDKYDHKLKDDLKKSQYDLRKAISTCNHIFADGRDLEDWEVESILDFLWTLEIKYKDMGIPDSLGIQIQSSMDNGNNVEPSIAILNDHYLSSFSSTLNPPMEVDARRKLSPLLNDFNKGMTLYYKSCLFCHHHNEHSHLRLEPDAKSYEFLKKHFDDHSSHSMYDILRYSPGSKGNHTGSPIYSAERMSDQQIQDLRFFITKMVAMGDAAIDYYKPKTQKEK